MPKYLFFIPISLCLLLNSCDTKQVRTDAVHQPQLNEDSIAYVQAQQNKHYSDSLLQVYIPQVNPLLRMFIYDKDEKVEDYGRFVHRLLETTNNTDRNFLQAYIMENGGVCLQSYYYGSKQQNQKAVRVSAGDNYLEKEGTNHVFEREGWHEILGVEGEEAMDLLTFIANHEDESIVVHSIGDQAIAYTLSEAEKQALSETCSLALLMREIDALEQSLGQSNQLIQEYEKKQNNSK